MTEKDKAIHVDPAKAKAAEQADEVVKTGENIERTRGDIEDLALISSFEESTVGQEILESIGTSNVLDIFQDDEIFDEVLSSFSFYEEEIEPGHLQGFLEVAAKRCPWLAQECFTISLFEIINLKDRERIWELVKARMAEIDGIEEDMDRPMPTPLAESSSDDLEVEEYMPPESEEEIISYTTRLLTEPGHKGELPQEVVDIIGEHETFKEAMEDDNAFGEFTGNLDELKEKVEPDLFSELLIVAAEQDESVYNFLKDYEVNSWHHAMQNHKIFLSFVSEDWLNKFRDYVEPPQLFHELLKVAAGTSKENAQWFLGKAEKDEAAKTDSESSSEEPEDKEYKYLPYYYKSQDVLGKEKFYNYVLRDILGEEAFEVVMEVARQTAGEEVSDMPPESVAAEKVEIKIDAETLAILKEFEEGDDYKHIQEDELGTLDETISNWGDTFTVLKYLERLQENIPPQHYRAFLIVAIENYPDLVFEFFKEYPYAVINNPETLEVVMGLFKDKGHEEVSAEMFKEPQSLVESDDQTE